MTPGVGSPAAMEIRRLLTAAIPFIILSLSPSFAAREIRSLSSQESLSPEAPGKVLVSPYGTFSAGFYEVGTNAFCFSVWFTHSADKTVVWMANRDRPVNGRQSSLRLDKKGNLVLRDADGDQVWESATSSPAATMVKLIETGNLVVVNQTGGVLWESFSSPTDTLLPYQQLKSSNRLVSRRGPGSYFSGFYSLRFNDYNILNLVYDGPEVSGVYWPNPELFFFDNNRSPYNSKRIASFNSSGRLSSTDSLRVNSSDDADGALRRLTMDYDGVARMYTMDGVSGNWTITWKADIHACKVHGLCGAYGICVYSPEPACRCPPGFRQVDSSDWSKGCSSPAPFKCNSSDTDFQVLQHADYYGYDLATFAQNISFEACKNRCSSDCNCKGFVYKLNGTGKCYPKYRLLNGYQMPDYPTVLYIKVSKRTTQVGSAEALNCTESRSILMSQYAHSESQSPYLKYLIAFVAAAGIVEGICLLFGLWWICVKTAGEKVTPVGYHGLTLDFKRFMYAELKEATHNFSEEIGRGGYGAVFKGVLSDGRTVAVKRLEGVSQGETEFWAEVSIIGRINHMNLAKMWGFCAEGKHRLLVYEFMENGSLDQILFSSSSASFGWKKRYDIARGTAKGLCYLHEECLEWVLHCDIKPQNILLDGNFRPKVGDFGLSKLIHKDNQIYRFSTVRGTRGYMAPEWMMSQDITAKADVYSYGVVLLELITGKSAADFQKGAQNLIQWGTLKLEQEGEMAIADPALIEDLDKEQLRRAAKAILMCLELKKERRPSMSAVVKVLESGDGGIF